MQYKSFRKLATILMLVSFIFATVSPAMAGNGTIINSDAGTIGLRTGADAGDYSTAMGYQTNASGNFSTAMGGQTNAGGNYSVAMGYNTTASEIDSVAMGANTTASGAVSIATGAGSIAAGIASFAGGGDASTAGGAAYGDSSFAFGMGAVAGKIVSGTGTPTDPYIYGGTNAISMGSGTNASGNYSVAMGFQTNASGDYSVAMGSQTGAYGNNSVAMGLKTIAEGHQSFAAGSGTTANGTGSVAMGAGTNARGNYSVAMGSNTNAFKTGSVALGALTNATGKYSMATGVNTNAGGQGSFAGGKESKAYADYSFSFGEGAIAGVDGDTTDGGQIALGNGAQATAANTVALGNGSTATGAQSIAIGTGNTVSGTGSGAFGDPNTVTGNNSYAIGNNNTIAQDNTFVLGSSVTTTQANSVVLGSGSADKVGTAVTSAIINGTTYNFKSGTTGSAANGVVSVGSVTSLRQIVNVANGKIETGSTDAVNGGQIFDIISNLPSGGEDPLAVRYDGSDKSTVTLAGAGGTKISNLKAGEVSPTSTDAVNGAQLYARDAAISANSQEIKEVGAISAALAGLHFAEPSGEEGDKFVGAVAYGNYRGESAGAIGVAYKPNPNFMLSASTSVGNDQNAYNAGVSFKFGKGETAKTKAELQKQVKYLNDKNNALESTVAQQGTEIQTLKSELEELKKLIKK